MKDIYNIKGTNGDIEINFTEKAINDVKEFKGSLVVPFYKENFVMSYHSRRKGWELPAGHREKGETAEECAIRETFEETGAILCDLKRIGYYIIKNKDGEHKIIIFVSNVEKFETKPYWSETGLVKLFDEIPEDISYNDDVYKIIFEYVKKDGINF